jgi:hypothetical protein
MEQAAEKAGAALMRKPLGAPLADAVRRSLRASAEVSARLVIVHAISPAGEAFSVHRGFARLPIETRTLALDLAKLRRVAGEG